MNFSIRRKKRARAMRYSMLSMQSRIKRSKRQPNMVISSHLSGFSRLGPSTERRFKSKRPTQKTTRPYSNAAYAVLVSATSKLPASQTRPKTTD